MAKTKQEEDSLLIKEDTLIKEEIISDEVQAQGKVEENIGVKIYTLEQKILDIGIKSANDLMDKAVPMNAKQIETVDALCRMYETLRI